LLQDGRENIPLSKRCCKDAYKERNKRLEILEDGLKLQREFARCVTAVEKLKTAQRVSLAELDALFATLQHRSFRGEL
jgi:hypothetical protein